MSYEERRITMGFFDDIFDFNRDGEVDSREFTFGAGMVMDIMDKLDEDDYENDYDYDEYDDDDEW